MAVCEAFCVIENANSRLGKADIPSVQKKGFVKLRISPGELTSGTRNKQAASSPAALKTAIFVQDGITSGLFVIRRGAHRKPKPDQPRGTPYASSTSRSVTIPSNLCVSARFTTGRISI